MQHSLLKVEIKYEHDVVLARQRARQIAGLLGFETQDQVRIATAVSELARNAFQYAGGGKVEFAVAQADTNTMCITISDRGPGIAQLKSILNGSYQSATGMGLGIIGARRLMDQCDIESEVGTGTVIRLSKTLPKYAPAITKKSLASIAAALVGKEMQNPFEEIQRQNQELLSALEEVQRQRSEVTQLNNELEETNRGVVALYAELDERADYLRRASDLKTQFLSNMTHEFRTPLNSILSISRMLLDRMDGELTSEQEKQVGYVHAAAQDLTTLVNDLLDLAKVEAGKEVVRISCFEVSYIFGMLRGMLKPLLEHNSALTLVFEESDDMPALETDEGKVSQILRNFISNGLKYTPKGEVLVSVKRSSEHEVTFSVTDTGIGIEDADLSRIFQEYQQIESSQQKQTKGTGLGLPLSKKLAELLGGHVAVSSTPGVGSTFSVTLPIVYQDAEKAPAERRLLIIDDNEVDRYILKRAVGSTSWHVQEANGGKAGMEAARQYAPDVIFLDLVMQDMSGFDVLKMLASDHVTHAIPIIIHTSKLLTDRERNRLSAATAIIAKNEVTPEAVHSLLESIYARKEAIHV